MADPISSIPGVSSGIDWKSLVDQIIALDKRPADRLQASIDANTKRKTALDTFERSAAALKTAASALTTATPFETFRASATGADAEGRAVVAAAAGVGATAGTYAVQVSALASAQKTTAGAGRAPAAAVGAAGSLTLGRGGATLATVAVDAADTLATVRDKINAANTGATPTGVQASLITVSATEQRLVLTAASAGSAGAFTLADDGASGLLGTLGVDPADADAARRPLGVAASDARFTLDGIAVTRSSNSAADVLPGVTLTLGAVGASTLSVTRQDSAATDAVKAFVDGYNALQKLVATQTGAKGDLANEPMLRTLRGQLPTLLLSPSADGVGDRKTLGSVGISLQRDGTLAFDASAYQTASAGREADVRALLGDRMQAVADLANSYSASGIGIADTRARALDDQSARYQARIDDITSRLDKKRTALLTQYAKFEASLGALKSLGDTMSAQFTGLNNANSSSS